MSGVPITIKWGKTLHKAKISIQPGSPAQDLKFQVQSITNVPSSRQKLLCPKCWKGALKDTDRLPDNISTCIPNGKNALVVTLIGSAEMLVEKPPEDRPRFVEDMTPEEVRKAQRIGTENGARKLEDDVDIVALQREPGEDRDDGKMEMYQYNRLVTGLPQHQIEDKLASRRNGSPDEDAGSRGDLLGEVAMTMGQELRRAYVNSLAVLKDGTLVSGLDDGHVQMWRRGELVKDIVHRAGRIDHVVTFPSSSVDGPSFVTGGKGDISIWTDEGNQLLGFHSPPGTTPASLATGSIGGIGDMKYLASCFSVARQADPNQFRLVPQDEAGRRRREAAEEQERLIQEDLARASRCVRIWFYDSSRSDSVGFGAETISSNGDEDAAPITKLADLNGKLVCGDEWGGIRIFEWAAGSTARSMSRQQSALVQIRCPGFHCKISCMEPIQNNLLAVSIHAVRNSTQEGIGLISSASPLHVTNPRGVCIIDVDRATVRAVLDAHTDIVQCICPLPDGGILTAGGKMDATVRVWEASIISTALQSGGEEEEDTPVLSEANRLKEPGYVFDLKVLPDSEPDSNVYAIAGARYNVIKIVI